MLHDKDSRGALAYLALASEMIRRAEEPEAYAAEIASGPVPYVGEAPDAPAAEDAAKGDVPL
jgi:hypothetical protein